MEGLGGTLVPIQQAPMGAVSGVRLVRAVAAAGGIGTLPVNGLASAQVAAVLDEVTTRASGDVAVNFTGDAIDIDAVAAAAERVRLVDFFWAEPVPALIEIVHFAGALASWQVGSVREAEAAADAGCDVLCVQGIEAGGHVRGTTALLPLLEQVLHRVRLPVLAAGGISDAPDVAAVVAAGASGVRIGTRFVATVESGAHPAYKQAVVDADEGSTVVTDAFADCPLCRSSPRAHVLRNAVAALEASARRGTNSRPGSGRPPTEETAEPVDAMAMYAGEGVSRITHVQTAANVIGSLTPTGTGLRLPDGSTGSAARSGS